VTGNFRLVYWKNIRSYIDKTTNMFTPTYVFIFPKLEKKSFFDQRCSRVNYYCIQMLLFRKKHSRRGRLPMPSNTPRSVFYDRGNLIPRTLGTPCNLVYAVTVLFIFGPLLAQQRLHTARHVLNTRGQPVYYAHYRHRRLRTGLPLLLRFFSVSLSGNPIGRYFPVMDFGEFRASPEPV